MKSEEYTFTLLLDGPKEIGEDLEDPLFDAGCDDALLYSKSGYVYLDFIRESKSFDEALISAIKQIESIDLRVMVKRGP